MPRREDKSCVWVVDGASFRDLDQTESTMACFDVWAVSGEFILAVSIVWCLSRIFDFGCPGETLDLAQLTATNTSLQVWGLTETVGRKKSTLVLSSSARAFSLSDA